MTLNRTRVFVFAVTLIAVAVTVAVAFLSPALDTGDVEAAVFFALAAMVASQLAYSLPGGGFGNIAFIPLLSSVAVAPGVATVLGASVALLLGEYFRHREPIRIVFNSAQLTIAVGLSCIVYRATGGLPLEAASVRSIVPFVAAFATYFFSNAMLFSAVVAVSGGQKFFSVLVRAAGGASLVYDLLGVPIVFGFAYAYVRIGWIWSGALLLPLVGLRLVYKTNRELQTVNEELLQLMVAAIEARDPYTSGHSQRVAAYSRVVARSAGIGPRGTERIYTAALLHDVGKIHEEFAPILRKPSRLNDDEFAVMKTHSAKGAVLVGKVSQFQDLVAAVHSHHEAWNGTGYPDGLSGDSIPVWARVIAFADTIDAMTTDRPYRAALTPEAVHEELTRQTGRQFDPAIATQLLSTQRWPDMVSAIVAARTNVVRADPQAAAMPRHSASHATLVGS